MASMVLLLVQALEQCLSSNRSFYNSLATGRRNILHRYRLPFSSVIRPYFVFPWVLLVDKRNSSSNNSNTSSPSYYRTITCNRDSRCSNGRARFVQRRGFALPVAIDKRVSSMDEKYQQILDSYSSSSSSSSSRVMEREDVSSLARVSKLYRKMKSLEEERSSIQELLEEAAGTRSSANSDANNLQEDSILELQEECRVELGRLEQSIQRVEQEIIHSLLPKDTDDVTADAILEIRSGAGGDEASLFAAELLSTYQRIASAKSWSCEILTIQSTDIGGIREVSLSISSSSSNSSTGKHSYTATAEYYDIEHRQEDQDEEENNLGPYGFFKWESGVHRVQRVPVNDVKLQTSTASVAVLPVAVTQQTANTTVIPPSELKIETMRASGAGGQHVNTTESAVRITHIPTGITATIQDERSQHRNRAKALRLIQGRVAQQLKAEELSKRGDHKRSLMGGGTRSERIRTYNFPQDRITDHRVGVTVHDIESRLSSSSSSSNATNSSNSEVSSSLVAIFAPHLRDAWRKESLKELMESDDNGRNIKS